MMFTCGGIFLSYQQAIDMGSKNAKHKRALKALWHIYVNAME